MALFQFNLACDEWRRSLVGSVRTFGTLVAIPISGYMSDRWGRKLVLSIVVLNGAWLGILRYWANTYVGYVIATFVESTLGSGGFACVYVLGMLYLIYQFITFWPLGLLKSLICILAILLTLPCYLRLVEISNRKVGATST